MPKPQIQLTRAEWTVIQAVWEHQPCAAPTIQEVLYPRTRWTYSTVRTIMDRMVAKGLLRSRKLRNLNLYRAAVTRAQAQRSELLSTLRHAFSGALTPMLQCLLDTGDLSATELEELEALIRAKRRQSSRKQ